MLDSGEHDRAVDVALSLFLADYDYYCLWLFLNVLSICLILGKSRSRLANCGQQSCFALKYVVWREEYDYCSLVVPPIEGFVVWTTVLCCRYASVVLSIMLNDC